MTGDTDATASEADARAARAEAPSQGCRFCGGPLAFALQARDRMHASGPSFDYLACADCGGLQIAAIPDDRKLAYGDDYYTAHQRVPSRRAGAAGGWRRVRTRLRLGLGSGLLARALSGRHYGHFEWLRRTGTGLDDAILDVGCGSGRLLLRMHADGFRRLVGIDPQLTAATAARANGRPGLRLEAVSPEAHQGTYHLVMAHHSLEHMAEPRRAFAAMASLLAPGGWILLRVPLADSWACAHYGADWAQLDAPRHLQIPTRRSVTRLAEQAGLALEHVEDDSGIFQIAGSERRVPRGLAARIVRTVALRRRAARLRREGRGDQAAFYLRRTPGTPRRLT